MKALPQGRSTKEFREVAVEFVTEGGLSLPEAGRRLSLPPPIMGNSVRVYKAGKHGDVGKTGL